MFAIVLNGDSKTLELMWVPDASTRGGEYGAQKSRLTVSHNSSCRMSDYACACAAKKIIRANRACY